MSVRYGSIESKFLSWIQNRQISVVRTGDLCGALRLSRQQEARLLTQMSKKGLVAKIKRGLYLAPRTLPPGGVFTPSPYLVLDLLMKGVRASDYQVSGQTVFNIYGFETQISNQLDIYNDKLSGFKKIARQYYRFIKVSPNRLGFTQDYQVKEREGEIFVKFSSPSRAVFDAIYDCEKFGTISKAFFWLKERIIDKLFMGEFLKILFKLGNISTMKRVGYVLEEVDYNNKTLALIKAKLPKKRSFVPLDPTKCSKGKVEIKWGLILNG